jgi:predicted glycoside hydrolase/deacetylase ChbG (UPF0249 family)
MRRSLLINADDFGYNDDVTDATIDLFERGAIRSATIMVGMPASARAIAYARSQGRRFSFGLHFNIVDGMRPHSTAPATLLDASGRFRMSPAQRRRASTFRLAGRDVEAELEAQLAALRSAGIEVSHIDSHGHLHKFPVVALAVRRVMRRRGVPHVRLPQSLYTSKGVGKRLLNFWCRRFFAGLSHPANTYLISDHGDPAWFDRLLATLPAGVTELAVHPGASADWLRAETVPLRDPGLRGKLEAQGVGLISYWDL